MKQAVFIALVFAVLAAGQDLVQAAAGTAAVSILKQSFSPRAEGMGEAQTVVPTDEAGAAGWNPAGLYGAYCQSFSAVYFRGLIDDALGSLAYSQTYNRDFSFGGALFFYDAGKFELNTMDGSSSQVNAERDFVGTATGAYKLNLMGRDIWTGLNFRLLHSTLLDTVSAFSFGLDLGMQYQIQEITPDLVAGVALKNVGMPLKYAEEASPLPLSLQAGASYRVFKDPVHRLLVAADFSINLEQTMHANLGVEYWHEDMIALRAGYKLGYDLDSLTLGAGLRYQVFQLDYAFSFMSALNSVHKLGLTYRLGVDGTRKKEIEEPKPKPTPVPTQVVAPKPAEPAPAVMAEVLEISDIVGGDVRSVILSIGRDKGIRPGMAGTIINGSPVARIVIMEVYPMRCKAKVTEKSGEIGKSAKAEIVKGKQ